MATGRGAVPNSQFLFAAIIVAMVAVMGVVSITSEPGGSASQSTSNTFVSGVSTAGLQLGIRVNATIIPQGGIVAAQVELINTLPTSVSLEANFSANPNIAAWDAYDSTCAFSSVDHIFGYALYQGHLTAANVSQAGRPLMLQGEPSLCANYLHPEDYIEQVEFPPNSDLATVSTNASESGVFPPTQVKMLTNATTEACAPSPGSGSTSKVVNGTRVSYTGEVFALGCRPGTVLYGYWPIVTEDPCSSPALQGAFFDACAEGLGYYFQPFPADSYTILAEDMWNQTAYAYFQATPTPSPVDVLSVTGPISPYNPGGPVVSVVLKNVGNTTITSLSATLPRSASGPSVPYSFSFNVNSSSPLFAGQTKHDTETLIGGGFDEGASYPLMINGTLFTGAEFSYTVQVQIDSPD